MGIEACAFSHRWARELTALGHEVRLMPAQYVKPYVKPGKNDAADAEAICEAVTRPTMRFVATKRSEQQWAMMLLRVRLVVCRQRTQLANALRAHLAEFGIEAPVGRLGLERLIEVVADTEDHRLPEGARISLQMLVAELAVVKAQVLENDRRIMADARAAPSKERLGSICKAGHCYLRQMLVVGSMAVIRNAERSGRRPWLAQLLAAQEGEVAAVALANKIARTVWAMMITGGSQSRAVAI